MIARLARHAQQRLGYGWSVTRPAALDVPPDRQSCIDDADACSADDATWWDLSGLSLRPGWYMLDVTHSRRSIGCRLTLHAGDGEPEHLLLSSKQSCKRIVYLNTGLQHCRISIDQPDCHLERLAFIGLTTRFAASRLRQRLRHRGQGSSALGQDMSSLYAAYRSHLHRMTRPVDYRPATPSLSAEAHASRHKDRSMCVGLQLVPVCAQGHGGRSEDSVQPAIDRARQAGWLVMWHDAARVCEPDPAPTSSDVRWFLMPVHHGVVYSPDALCRLLAAITADTVLLYADHDHLDEHGERSSPALKPEWNPDLLLGHDYIMAPWIISLAWVRSFLGARAGSRAPAEIEQAMARISTAPASLLLGASLGIGTCRPQPAASVARTPDTAPDGAVATDNHWPALTADQVKRVPAVLASLFRSASHITNDPDAIACEPTAQHLSGLPGSGTVAPTGHWRQQVVSALHEAGSMASVIGIDGTPTSAADNEFSGRAEPFRIRWPLPSKQPEVAIIVPTRDQSATLRVCIESILQRTDYRNYRLCIVDNDSRESETAECLNALLASDSRVQVLTWSGEFNYSAINNHAVAQVDAPVIVLLNNDTEVISRCWLDEMTRQALRPDIGCVGAKLYYSNRRIQHGGVIVGINGVAGHAHRYSRGDADGYCRRLRLPQNLTAVTAACLAIRRPLWQQLGGLDERHLGVAWNDVDLCLRAQAMGYRNLWTPHAELFHHEGLSRGADDNPAKRRRVDAERRYMMEHWQLADYIDPAYHPLLSTDDEGFALGDALSQPG